MTTTTTTEVSAIDLSSPLPFDGCLKRKLFLSRQRGSTRVTFARWARRTGAAGEGTHTRRTSSTQKRRISLEGEIWWIRQCLKGQQKPNGTSVALLVHLLLFFTAARCLKLRFFFLPSDKTHAHANHTGPLVPIGPLIKTEEEGAGRR